MIDDQFLELSELDLVPYLSWLQQYFQTLIGSCTVTDLVLNRLMIVAYVLMFSPPCMTLVVSISLVGLTPFLFCLHVIIFTWCRRLNFFVCIPICVNGINISSLTSLLLKNFQTCLKPFKIRLIASMLLENCSKPV